jgi:AraC-like DNA-binding protein
LGAAITASAHGSMGYAAVSSATIGQALQAIARFTPMRNRLFDYRCRTDATGTELSVLPRIDMGAYRGFLEIATAVSVFKTVQSLAGDGAAQRMHMDVTWQRGDPLDVRTPVRYSQPTTSLHVPAEVAGVRTLTADPQLHAYACRSCEEELAALSGSVTAQLRRLLPGVGQNWPSLTEAAGKLAMSRSTLIRRLADEGLAFQDVLDQTRRELACWYLRETEMPIISVAERLGYIDPSNFSRSFRRWQGTAPLQYRQSQRPQVAASLQEADTGAGVFAQAPGHHAAG